MTLQDVWDRIASVVIAARSVARGLALFTSARPRTPLRVLCIMAFDAVHALRHAQPLPPHRVRMLATLLDFGACANAAFDNKDCRPKERHATLQVLADAGLGSFAREYLRRWRDLESRRPAPGGAAWQFREVVRYREAVVRLSLGMVATAADGRQCLDEGIRATHGDAELNLLFRIVMQCQIIDDVLDYAKDTHAGLPSFLTAAAPLARALELTRLAALAYADDRHLARTGAAFSLRLALLMVSTCTRLVIVVGRWRPRTHLGRNDVRRAERLLPC